MRPDSNARRHGTPLHLIMARGAFTQGFEDARAGRPFSAAYERGDRKFQWTYERGRLLAVSAPQLAHPKDKQRVRSTALYLYRQAKQQGAIL
jgi:hypothetical protein